MNSNTVMIKKLRNAINNRGERLLYNTTEFFSEEQQRPITLYIIKKALYDEQRGKNRNIELFTSASQIQIVLFLRDYWFKLNGWELPVDNEKWNGIRRSIECLCEGQKVEDISGEVEERLTMAKVRRVKRQNRAAQSKQVKGGRNSG